LLLSAFGQLDEVADRYREGDPVVLVDSQAQELKRLGPML